jgi:hypothetical protein
MTPQFSRKKNIKYVERIGWAYIKELLDPICNFAIAT